MAHKSQKALEAATVQHELGLREASRLYAPALGCAFLFSLGVVVAGFDPQLIRSLSAIPTFQRDFGQKYQNSYVVEASWQSAFNLGLPIGQVFGSFGAGYPLERFGRRWTLGTCCIITCAAVGVQVAAQNKAQILVAELINGLVLGAYPVIGATYISEVLPVVLRGLGAALVNLSFIGGQLIASGVLAGTQARTDRWSYDIPFACQWIFPCLILVFLPFCPESPWWLVRKKDFAKSERALIRLSHHSIDQKALLADVVLTVQQQDEQSTGHGFVDCFKGSDRRRTIISVMVYAIQPLAGNFFFSGYAVYFFTVAGLETAQAFDLGIGLLALGFIGTCLSSTFIARYGRRTIYSWGLLVLTIMVLVIAVLSLPPSYDSNPSLLWAQSALMVIYNLVYNATIGPLCYVILCETSSAKLRSKTVAIATAANALINIACAVAIPYALNPSVGNLKGKLAFVFLGTALPCLIWCWTSLPETKGRTFEELDIMFQRSVPTSQFKTYEFEAGTGFALPEPLPDRKESLA